jgi:hypothetical protein
VSYDEKFTRAESAGEEGVFTRIDEVHPVGIFLGLEGGQRAVLIVCSKQPPEPPSLTAIHVEVRSRQHGEWALVLRLARPDLKALFTRLVEDLAGATRQRPEDAGDVVISRLARWQRLLSRGELGVLEDHELRGLAAELDFLLREAIVAVGLRAAVASWVGPYAAPKDFVFDRVEVEVKAVHRQQRLISISSLEQLSDTNLPLYLWSRTVDLGIAAQGGANSFAAFVARVREAVAYDILAAEALEDRLRAAGYQDRPEYMTRTVHFGPTMCFRVAGEFPRLQRGLVSPAVVTCCYEIATADLDPFRVGTWREAPSDGR